MAANSERISAQKVGEKRRRLNFRFIGLEIDTTLFVLIVVLLVMGIIMMFSAYLSTDIPCLC